MGCVSSNLLSPDDEFTKLGSSALSHHIVSLTSSTYGLLTLDPPTNSSTIANPTTPPTPSFRFAPVDPPKQSPCPQPESKSLWSEPRSFRPCPEVINSWELMAGLDADSFRFFPNKENLNPNNCTAKPKSLSKRFQEKGDGESDNRVVIYTTSLRGVRKTFEDCDAARAAIEGFGVSICERDVSMDRGFREELKELMRGHIRTTNEEAGISLPQVFVKGKYIGGAEEILKFAEEGLLGKILQGLPTKKAGTVCEGCGDVRFLPCFECSGSCKVVLSKTVVVRCSDCNENGLVLCPICS